MNLADVKARAQPTLPTEELDIKEGEIYEEDESEKFLPDALRLLERVTELFGQMDSLQFREAIGYPLYGDFRALEKKIDIFLTTWDLSQLNT